MRFCHFLLRVFAQQVEGDPPKADMFLQYASIVKLFNFFLSPNLSEDDPPFHLLG